MRDSKNLGFLALPVAATLAAASLASADQLNASIASPSFVGTEAYDCNIVASTGLRAHLQTLALGEDIYGQGGGSVYSTELGTTQSTQMIYPGKRHRALLQSHLVDLSTGQDVTYTLCDGGWTSAWTEQSDCSTNVYASANPTSGSCSVHNFQASSWGYAD